MNKKRCFICILIAIILLVFVISCQKMDEADEARRLAREESTLVYSGVLVRADGWPAIHLLTWVWRLHFKDGVSVSITKSRSWLVPIGEEIDVYKYVDEFMRDGGRKLYFIKRKIGREKKEE